MSNQTYYKNLQFHRLGRWATYPADVELWHTVHTSRYFEEQFGIWKEILAICVFDEGDYGNRMYTPISFIKKLHQRINEITSNDPKGLKKILLKFYEEKIRAKKEIPLINPPDLSSLNNLELAEVYRRNRDAAHRIVVYDQFTWLGEDYWIPLMDKILVGRIGLAKDTPEYNEALFALTKPREISTTLEEKRTVLALTLDIQLGKITVDTAAQTLAREYGWMPVLAYGTPWDAERYQHELQKAISQIPESIRQELSQLNQYSELRDKDLEAVVQKYEITQDELQIFIDFGLAIDTRNEAEYVASVAGFYLLPLYDQMMQRLGLTIIELRSLYETEIIACLEGKANARAILDQRGHIRAWGITEDKEKIDFSADESEKLFQYVEEQQNSGTESTSLKRGITASKGRATGRVKLVPSPVDNDKVQPGDILIAYSTMVDNLPAMKRAAAFVTESGGLTCHAAVVAREFGVPCIVSFKNAMSEFKDGDLVEVDADSAVIKKLG